MNKQQLVKSLLEGLKGNKQPLTAKEPTDISLQWGLIKAEDGKNYDAHIQFLLNNKLHATLVATENCLENSINFKKQGAQVDFDQQKLDKLVTEIENKLKDGGNYKLETASPTGFRVTLL